MKNVKMTKKGNTLTVEIDLTQNFGPSRTGKTIIVASTEGNKKVPDTEDIFIGVNVYAKR